MAKVYTATPGCGVEFSTASEAEFGWRLSPDYDWFDSTCIAVIGKDGSLLFFQGLIANIRPMYVHQPAFHVKYVSAEGACTQYSQKFDTSQLELSDDGTSVKVCGISFKRTASDNGYHIVIDDPTMKDIKGELTCIGCDSKPFKFGEDGKIAYNDAKTNFTTMHYICPRASVTGVLNIKEKEIKIDGWGFMNHYNQNMKHHYICTKRQHIKFHSPEVSLCMQSIVTPKSHGKVRITHGMFVYENKLTAITIDNNIVIKETLYDPVSYYDIPTNNEYYWKGKTHSGEPFEAEIKLIPTNLVDKYDILGHLPWAIRMIIKKLLLLDLIIING